jgi:hypothetical protein
MKYVGFFFRSRTKCGLPLGANTHIHSQHEAFPFMAAASLEMWMIPYCGNTGLTTIRLVFRFDAASLLYLPSFA